MPDAIRRDEFTLQEKIAAKPALERAAIRILAVDAMINLSRDPDASLLAAFLVCEFRTAENANFALDFLRGAIDKWPWVRSYLTGYPSPDLGPALRKAGICLDTAVVA